MKKILGVIFIALSALSYAQNINDFANAAKQMQGIVQNLQQIQASQSPESTPAQSATSSGASCFVSDSKNTKWATGDRTITSCDPAVIERQITQPYGSIQIWQFLNDREILRSFIFGAQMRSNNNFTKNAYERKGNRIIENSQGCKITWDIVNETPDSITIHDVGAAGSCDRAVIDATNKLSKMPPSVYIKIKG
jgi:hypothetical protein